MKKSKNSKKKKIYIYIYINKAKDSTSQWANHRVTVQNRERLLKEKKKRVRLSFINFISYFHSFHFSFQWEIERESERKRERNTLREEASSIEHRSSWGAKQSAIYDEGQATMTSNPATMCSGLDRSPKMCEQSPMSDNVL